MMTVAAVSIAARLTGMAMCVFINRAPVTAPAKIKRTAHNLRLTRRANPLWRNDSPASAVIVEVTTTVVMSFTARNRAVQA